jgi:hypothetical protein
MGRTCCPVGLNEYTLGVDMGMYQFTVEGRRYNYILFKDDTIVTNALNLLSGVQLGIDSQVAPSQGYSGGEKSV